MMSDEEKPTPPLIVNAYHAVWNAMGVPEGPESINMSTEQRELATKIVDAMKLRGILPTRDSSLGFIDIGPEAFAAKENTVISWRGENFYRACDEPVVQNPDGSGSFCVKPTGHKSMKHEDMDGNEVDIVVPTSGESEVESDG